MSTTDKLAEAIELAEDAMAYVPEYFANKHGMLRRMAALKEVAAHEQAQAGDRAMASDWSWTGVRMELEASGRDDLSAWVSQQIEPKAHAGEPVVPYLYVYEYDSPFGLHREFYPSGWNGQKPTRTVALYTTQQPAQAERVGLTREQIVKIMTAHYPLDSMLRENVDAFEACVRDIERAHGIGGAKESSNVEITCG